MIARIFALIGFGVLIGTVMILLVSLISGAARGFTSSAVNEQFISQ